MLDLHDFPGQGTALVGVLDPFWDSKPYVTPAEYKRFCDAIVPLVALVVNRCGWEDSKTRHLAEREIADWGSVFGWLYRSAVVRSAGPGKI